MKQNWPTIIFLALLIQGTAFADEDKVEMIGKFMLRTFGNSETTGYQAVARSLDDAAYITYSCVSSSSGVNKFYFLDIQEKAPKFDDANIYIEYSSNGMSDMAASSTTSFNNEFDIRKQIVHIDDIVFYEDMLTAKSLMINVIARKKADILLKVKYEFDLTGYSDVVNKINNNCHKKTRKNSRNNRKRTTEGKGSVTNEKHLQLSPTPFLFQISDRPIRPFAK